MGFTERQRPYTMSANYEIPPNSDVLRNKLRSCFNFRIDNLALLGYPESSIVKPISSPRTSIEKQRSFTRVRSMGAAAADSAQIR